MKLKLLAQVPLGNLSTQGQIGNTNTGNALDTFARVLSSIIGVLTIVAALIFVFQLFSGAISWISAGNDKQAIDSAKKRITNGLTGLLIVVVSYTLIAVVGSFLGFDIINLRQTITNVRLQP